MQTRRTQAPRRSGIYAITNTVTGEQYIGSSMDINMRWLSHRSLLRAGKNTPPLQAAWERDGAESFTLEVLELVDDVAQLADRESDYLSQRNPAYNLTHRTTRVISASGMDTLRRPDGRPLFADTPPDAPARTLSEWRQAACATQSEFAELLNVSASAMSLWERGKRVPGIRTRREIAEALGIRPQQISFPDMFR